MSKINAVRFINLNYNNQAIHISDETLHLNGESTLISLRNGGGKSVLVQMLTAPFVHKRYRDAKDRPFESYFSTAKPSFILVEWALDQGAGYVLTGMMVRKSQEAGEQVSENLEMVNFISEYREPCLWDIHHLPVVEKGKKEIRLKSFSACCQLFESYKKDRTIQFFCYDMIQPAQSRQYFEKLREYQIHDKEWETIIKKINLKESGLSELFNDCRDEKGLVEKWFLEAVESKLNKEKNRMKEFQSILEKYVGQYKDNQSKIQQRDTVRRFKEEAVQIQEKAETYLAAAGREQEQENRIISFAGVIGALKRSTGKEHEQVLEQIQGIRRKLERAAYEKLSAEFYQYQEEQKFHVSNREMLEMEQEALEKEVRETEKKIHLLVCAKWQASVDEEKREWDVAREKLSLHRKKAQDLEPEQKGLGYTLKCYYQQRLEDNRAKEEENQRENSRIFQEMRQEKEKSETLCQEMLEAVARQGRLSSQADAYDQQEEGYNNRYQEQLTRNILGEYEPGSLENRMCAYEKELEEDIRKKSDRRKNLENLGKEQHRLERELENSREELLCARNNKEQQEARLELFDQELKERRTILQYLDLEEDALFDLEKIVDVSGRKLAEISNIRRNLEKEENALQKEYIRLTQGKVLELPEEFASMLQELGIPIAYGMEWLKKNGYPEEENKKLVDSHPFLPYALLLSRQDLEKLSRHAGEVYTSFPVPILLREQLSEREEAPSPPVVCLPQVSFYMLFNQNLLNETKLQQLVQEKERQIEKVQESIKIREDEYREYFARQEKVKNQAVDKKEYDKTQKMLQDLEAQILKLDGQQRNTAQKISQGKEEQEKLEQSVKQLEREIDRQNIRLEDYRSLCQAYQKYQECRRQLEQCERQKERLENRLQISENILEELTQRQRTLDADRESLRMERQELGHSLRQYQAYEEGELKSGDIHQLEARYQAITSGMTLEIKELERQQQNASRRYENAREELQSLQKKYSLEDGEWDGILYSGKEEAHLEIICEDKKEKIRKKNQLWNDEKTAIAVLEGNMQSCRKKIQEECRKEEPLAREEIQAQDYDAVKNQLYFQEKEAQKTADILQAKIISYDENLTALAEYTVMEEKEKVSWEQDFKGMSGEELRTFKGILLRDYNQRSKERQEARDTLVHVLNQTARLEDFQEDSYRKPLESMIELSAHPDQVLQQLSVTLLSYDNLMEKLGVDISLVEKEKERIVELLQEYVWEVHQNLGKIDRNSTITIRERPVKMLKIQLPDWEENEKMYLLHLNDFIDEITKKGLGLFEKNENAQEYFGTQITTRNLYDAVVGIGNVQIRLYKIEAQREYAITWTEVARNSGGEGFLSAFVILSSLLHYMRKDDSDILADKNEGKVLLMDNPFAQTNAAHLLKPLMDVAKKANTQLICLTGLGGESIYHRFDNIYVLNLLAASLRTGMQYLKAEHLQGAEPETMIVSRVQVAQQQELPLF